MAGIGGSRAGFSIRTMRRIDEDLLSEAFFGNWGPGKLPDIPFLNHVQGVDADRVATEYRRQGGRVLRTNREVLLLRRARRQEAAA